MKLYDAFPTKAGANSAAKSLRMIKKYRPQLVSVKAINQGRLKWGVFVGGKNSSMY